MTLGKRRNSITPLTTINDGFKGDMREVYIEGVFDSPREVAELEGKIDPFDEFNWHYPIPNGVIGQLNNFILNNEYRWMHILNADTENNGKDDKN